MTILCEYLLSIFNLLAYADNLVLLAPSWRGLQHLVNILLSAADHRVSLLRKLSLFLIHLTV